MSLPSILVVALEDSIHTARWIKMVMPGPWRVVLLPATRRPPTPDLGALWPIRGAADLAAMPGGRIGLWCAEPEGEEQPEDDLPAPIGFFGRGTIVRGATIARAVRALRPALLHTMELQCAGYAGLAAAGRLGADRPPWLVSNWGSDVFLYHRLAEHRRVLRAVMAGADAALNECARDVPLMRGLGFRGRALPVMPAAGGLDFDRLPRLDALPPPSRRRGILVKGYHGWAGRAMHALSAVHLAAPALRGFAVRVLLAPRPVAEMADRLAETDGLDIAAAPWVPDHGAAVERFGTARLIVSCGISDGIGTTLLEALALGAFPVVSDTCCIGEWLAPGRDGFLLSPHDIDGMARAIIRAATDDAMVDAAAPRNRAAVERGFDRRVNGERAVAAYREAIGAPRRSAS